MKIIISKVQSRCYLTLGGAWSPDKSAARLFEESSGFQAIKIFRSRGESVTFEVIKDVNKYNDELNRLKSVKLSVKREIRDKKKVVELAEFKSGMKKAGKLDRDNKPIAYCERRELKLKRRIDTRTSSDLDHSGLDYSAGLGADEFNLSLRKYNV